MCRWLPTGAELSLFRQQRPCSPSPAAPRNGQAIATACDARLLIQGISFSALITENALDSPGCSFLDFDIHIFLTLGSGSLLFPFTDACIFRVPYLLDMFSKDGAKPDMRVGQVPVDAGEAYSSSKGGTSDDQIDMFRMGKVQELKVCFDHGQKSNNLASGTS